MKSQTNLILPGIRDSLAVKAKKKKKKKDVCCEKFKKKDKSCCKSCPLNWG
jgi:hypothetical protein